MRAGGRTPITIRRFDAESGIPGPGMPLLFCSLRFFLRPHDLGAQEGDEGDGQDDADGAGHAADDLDGDGIGVEDLDHGIIKDLEQQERIEARTGEGKDERIRHGAHGVLADVHAGAEQGLARQVGVQLAQLPAGGGNGTWPRP